MNISPSFTDIRTNFVSLNIANTKNSKFKDSNSITIIYRIKECDPFEMIESWTRGNDGIDNFIKDTIYDAGNNKLHSYEFLEWAPTIWIDAKYNKQDDGAWKNSSSEDDVENPTLKLTLGQTLQTWDEAVKFLND
ncbi:hypothetical protein C1646_751249 [Rhizophagus diaphanus]|nr:hypothetical protein C1646_751249 [Rhizophagus diaphanus] [Rhizophagus sp. MUCL 43196]